jgi:hypothetical protein
VDVSWYFPISSLSHRVGNVAWTWRCHIHPYSMDFRMIIYTSWKYYMVLIGGLSAVCNIWSQTWWICYINECKSYAILGLIGIVCGDIVNTNISRQYIGRQHSTRWSFFLFRDTLRVRVVGVFQWHHFLFPGLLNCFWIHFVGPASRTNKNKSTRQFTKTQINTIKNMTNNPILQSIFYIFQPNGFWPSSQGIPFEHQTLCMF